ncbi:MAG TPA: hypothetical protein VMV94_05860 [Phycisphaerae bacterium]|nr:hypothetical protein [Phycisphaerae bacterium]
MLVPPEPDVPRALSYPLNPVDNALLATHESLRRRGYCGLSVMLIADLEGPLDPKDLAAAASRLGRAYPALSAHIRFTPITRRAYWHVGADAALEDAVEYEHHFVDPTAQDADAPLRRALDDPVDPTCGPQLRLVHVQAAPDRHRLGLRWSHPLMDMEGGHLLMRELHALLCDEPLTLGADPRAAVRRPYPWRFPKSLLRVWQGRLRHAYHDLFRQPRVVARPENATTACNFQLRRYDAAFRKQFETTARRRISPGPLLYTRALMIGIARTYIRMATERGRPREHYLFSHALPLPREGGRPGVHGNHVIIPWIVFASDDLTDWTRADAVAATQFRDYVAGSGIEATWEMYRATQRWPFPATLAVTTHRIPRGAAGCTSYRFGDQTRRLGAAKIINLAGAGPMNCHPGWLVGNTTFGDTMSISITHFEDYFDSPSVSEFLDHLETEISGA